MFSHQPCYSYDVIRTHILLRLCHRPSCPKHTHKQNLTHTGFLQACNRIHPLRWERNLSAQFRLKYSSSLSHLKDHIKTSQSTPTGVTMSKTVDKDRKGERYVTGFLIPTLTPTAYQNAQCFLNLWNWHITSEKRVEGTDIPKLSFFLLNKMNTWQWKANSFCFLDEAQPLKFFLETRADYC